MALNMRDALKYDEGVDAGAILGRKEGLKEGLKKGRQKGLKEGRQKEKFDTARRMKAMGMPGGQILQATGLSLNEIDAL